MITDRMVTAASDLLSRRIGRRGFLVRTAVVGSAITTSGLDFVLQPQSAYASVCGTGSSCGSGWTAMCCTINAGVNQCPPGSFAGGWWKADGARLCGGRPRYYVDCQAECTHCGCGGGAFCASQCRNCRSHCADGSCDKRHVCRAVFRYGQCERDRHCSGPVLCRAISCTPPWEWLSCSKASATDNATRSHSSSCLSGWSHIAKRYTELGSQASALGATVHAEYEDRHARVQHYQHGRMYWTHHTGAHFLTGHLAAHYLLLHEHRSRLGLPTSDAHRRPDHGIVAQFEHGVICQPPHADRAFALWDVVHSKWSSLGGIGSPLGYPASDVTSLAHKGERAMFKHGGIFSTPATGTHALWGAVASTYDDQHRQAGPLGYPTTDVVTNHDGRGKSALFQAGIIEHRPDGRTYALSAGIAHTYLAVGKEQSPLGYPTSDITSITTSNGAAEVAHFDDGWITEVAGAPAAHAVWGVIAQTWEDNGAGNGKLGFPVTSIYTNSDDLKECEFAHGTITYNPKTGQVIVTEDPA